jgi:predicted lipid-binding transport protein (Tim44 family)
MAIRRSPISRLKRGKLIDGAYFMAHSGHSVPGGDNLLLKLIAQSWMQQMPAFKPETLAAIALALEMATADLAVVEPKLREAIEARIVAAAEATGEADPVKLCEAALNRA